MASVLLGELKTVATMVKRGQIEDAMGTSWAAPGSGRGIRTLLVEAGAEGGGGRGGMEKSGGVE